MKSWDVQRSARKARAIEVVAERSRPKTAKVDTLPLKKRREKKQKVFLYSILVFIILFSILIFYIIWRPALRVSVVTAEGQRQTESIEMTTQVIQGTYAYVLPRNSIFLLPVQSVRANILNSLPEISAVGIERTSFNSVHVKLLPRSSAFLWCGIERLPTELPSTCYHADAEGFVFKKAGTMEDTHALGPNKILLYAQLPEGVSEDFVIGTHIMGFSGIPNILLFTRTIGELGIQATAVSLKDDEVYVWVGNTKIMYLLGKEKEAALLAASIAPTLDLSRGDIEYIDLRFSAKAYIKRF